MLWCLRGELNLNSQPLSSFSNDNSEGIKAAFRPAEIVFRYESGRTGALGAHTHP